MILTRKRLLVDIFSLADYQNHSHFASLRALISSPVILNHDGYFFLLIWHTASTLPSEIEGNVLLWFPFNVYLYLQEL